MKEINSSNHLSSIFHFGVSEHDIEFVYEVKHELVEMTNETNSSVTKFKYFAD